MATQGSFTIGGTSPDYATVQAWADSPTGNLTGVYEGLVRAETYAENVDINIGFTTSASAYMQLKHEAGAHHLGLAGDGAVLTGASTVDDHIMQIFDPYTRIIGVEFTEAKGRSNEAIRLSAGNCRIEQVLFYDMMTDATDCIYGAYTSSDPTYISNCHAAYVGRSFFNVEGSSNLDGATVYIYNCTGIYMAMARQNQDVLSGGFIIVDTDAATTGRTFHVKNCYGHVQGTRSWVTGANRAAYQKPTNDSWGNSTNNGSYDTSAPGTNAQTNASLSSQFVSLPTEITAGNGTSWDYNTGSSTDCLLNQDDPTNNVQNAPQASRDTSNTPNQVKNSLFRWDLTNLPAMERVWGSTLHLTSTATIPSSSTNVGLAMFQVARNWVPTEVTWNIYSTGNSWTNAGAMGSPDLVEGAEWTSDPTNEPSGMGQYDGADVSDGDTFAYVGSKMSNWIKEATNGNGASGVGGDYLDIMVAMTNNSVANDQQNWRHQNYTTEALRPHLRIWYHASGSPPDWSPDAGGVLDANGTDLSGDANYPISVDVTGTTRSSWDIGAFAFTSVAVSASDGTDAGDTATAVLTVVESETDGAEATDAATAALTMPVSAKDGTVAGDAELTHADLLHVTPYNIKSLTGYSFTRATTATYVDASGLIQTAASGELRNEHYEGGERTILTEPASTNEVTQSESLSGGNWAAPVNCSITANTSVAPDGTTTADRITNNTGARNGSRVRMAFTGTSGQDYTFSTHVTQTSTGFAAVSMNDSANHWAEFDLSGEGSVNKVSSSPPDDYGIKKLPNGEFRIWATHNVNQNAIQGKVHISDGGALSFGLPGSEDGDTADFWGSQLEQSSFPTSYIPTSGASATRNADELQVDVGFDPQSLTVFVDGVVRDNIADFADMLYQIGAPAGVRFRAYASSSAGRWRTEYDDGSATDIADTGVSASFGDSLEVTGRLASNSELSTQWSINGGAVGTTTDASISTSIAANWGSDILRLGYQSSGVRHSAFAFKRVTIATGVQSLDAMRDAGALATLTLPGSNTEGSAVSDSATVITRSHSKLCIIYD